MRHRGFLGAALAAALVLGGPRAARPGDDDSGGGDSDEVAAPTAHFIGTSPEAFGLPSVRELGWIRGDAESGSVQLGAEVQRLLEDEITKEGGVFTETGESRVGVRGSAAAVDLFHARIADLTRALDGRVAVDVSVVRVPAAAPGGLSREALLELVRAGKAEVLHAERLAVRRGETVRRESSERRPFLASLEAEVAQDASITVPRAMELWTGRQLAVHARPLPSGRTAVTLSFHMSRPEQPMRREPTSGGTLELPEVRFVSLTAPFLLGAGETGTARIPDPFGDGTILVGAVLAEGPAKSDGPWRVADLSVPAGNVLAERAFVTPGWVAPADDDTESPEDETWAERVDACEQRLTTAGLGGEALARGLVAMQGGVAAAFEELFQAELRTGAVARTSLRVATARLAAASWYDPLEGRVTGDVAPDAGRHGPALRLPLRGDMPTLFLAGTWRRVVSDLTTEIAQGAVAVVPVVQDHFEGEAVLARLVATGPGRPPVADVQHRTAFVLDRTPRAALVRAEIGGQAKNDDGTKIDAMTTASSRARIDLGKKPVTTIRREGGDSVLEVWELE